MSYEKRPNKRKVAPSKEKSIIEDIPPANFGSGNMEQRTEQLSVFESCSSGGTGAQSVSVGKDPLAISPNKEFSGDLSFTQSSSGDSYCEMEADFPGGALMFDETELDMEEAEIYYGDGHGERLGLHAEVEEYPMTNEFDEEFFADKLRRGSWLGLSTDVLNKIQSETELLELCGGEREVDFELEDEEEEEEGWETLSESSDSSGEMDPDGDWEESLVYVELDDLPNIQELFATHPDDFLRFQHRNKRHISQTVKATHPKLDFHFHNFTSSRPMLQIGQRYFSGHWEEVTGSAVFFRRNGEIVSESASGNNSSAPPRPCEELKNIVPEPDIPFDPVFMKLGASYKNAYELVAVADKVLKMSAHIASTKKMPKTINPARNRLITGGKLSVPKGYSARAILAGQYQPMRKYTNKKYKTGKVEKWKEIQGKLTIIGDNSREPRDISEITGAQDDPEEEEILS